MKKVLVLIATLIASPAFADGFVCESAAQGLKVQVYNQTQPSLGTRSAAIMILSDMNVQAGRKTIATFKSTDARLENTGALYTADVDLRFSESSRKGENIAGTKLGEVDQILLDVSFSYDEPVQDGTDLDGQVTIVKRNGEKSSFYAVCTRYLKGE
jgi:hypothetical protein